VAELNGFYVLFCFFENKSGGNFFKGWVKPCEKRLCEKRCSKPLISVEKSFRIHFKEAKLKLKML